MDDNENADFSLPLTYTISAADFQPGGRKRVDARPHLAGSAEHDDLAV